MPRRFDSGTTANLQRTPQGGYCVKACVGRIGVQTYRNTDGTTRRELRLPEEIFAPQSLGTLAGAPVTDDHPPGAIDPSNWSTFAKGHVSDDVGRDGNFILTSLIVQDSGLCQKIEDGRAVECSCGYSCDIEETSGIWEDGTPYDVIQRKPVYNHVALGPKGWGRAGAGASLRLDSADAVEDTDCMKVMVAGKEYESGSAEHVKALEALVASEKARADSATPTAEAIRKASSARARLLFDCQEIARFKGRRFDAEAAEGADDSKLMLESIKEIEPDFKQPEGAKSGYLEGYFDAIKKSAKKDAKAPEMLDAKAAPAPPEMLDAKAAPAPDKPEDKPGFVPPPAKDGRADARSIFTARASGAAPDAQTPAKDPIREAQERNYERSANAYKPKESK